MERGLGPTYATLIDIAHSPPIRDAFFQDRDAQFLRGERLVGSAEKLRQHLRPQGAGAHPPVSEKRRFPIIRPARLHRVSGSGCNGPGPEDMRST